MTRDSALLMMLIITVYHVFEHSILSGNRVSEVLRARLALTEPFM